MIKLFAYGTLLNKEIQIELFGKEIFGTPDSISGYKVMNILEIEGKKYPKLVKQTDGIVFGKIYELSKEQMDIIDQYETSAYSRSAIKTNNEIIVDIYK